MIFRQWRTGRDRRTLTYGISEMTLLVLQTGLLGAGLAAVGNGVEADPPLSPLVQGTVSFVLGVLCVAVVLALVRLIRGPNIADRVVALDLIATIIVGMTAVLAIATSEPTFLSVSIVLALVAFLGTVAFAYYVQRGGQP